MKNMLSEALSAIRRFFNQLFANLEVENTDAKNTILNLISGRHKLTLDACDGSDIIAEASDVFSYIDPDFRSWNAGQKGLATKEVEVSVYGIVKDATFAQMFGSLGVNTKNICLTQAQIISFVKKHRDWLRKDGYGTFFLFESSGEVFVAFVDFEEDGKLYVGIDRFKDVCVLDATFRNRVVVPQLADAQ